jgi:hypothetical protein
VIILHHFDVDFTCCELCALLRLAEAPEEKDYLYSVDLYPHETITCNDCDEDVEGKDEEDVNPFELPTINQYK